MNLFASVILSYLAATKGQGRAGGDSLANEAFVNQALVPQGLHESANHPAVYFY